MEVSRRDWGYPAREAKAKAKNRSGDGSRAYDLAQNRDQTVCSDREGWRLNARVPPPEGMAVGRGANFFGARLAQRRGVCSGGRWT